MKKLGNIILLLFFSQLLSAKVAYLPLITNAPLYPDLILLMALDLDSGQILNQVEIGDGVGAVFVDDSGKQLFAAASKDMKIVHIDTETLEIVEQWNNLPTNPARIILSEDNNKLYFVNTNAGTGSQDMFQIDLSSNQISSVLSFPNFTIQDILYSENLKFLSLILSNNSTNQLSIQTYNSNDLILKYTTSIITSPSISMIDNEGENYYLIDNQQSKLESRTLSDDSVNWSFTYPGESEFYSIYEHGVSNLIASGSINSYQINKLTGNGSPLVGDGSNMTLSDSYDRIDLGNFVQVEKPYIDCNFLICALMTKLDIKKINLVNNTSEIVYQSQNALGSQPKGRFVGENLYRGTAVQQVPVSNYLSLMLLLAGFIFLASLRNTGLKNK
ncbi:MAG: hypothetical protein DWP95_12815 [Proteobacteria bacterium]|nr:MAG: hypothetical protein DWP95_12815 [Pseudomonadota bacterium]